MLNVNFDGCEQDWVVQFQSLQAVEDGEGSGGVHVDGKARGGWVQSGSPFQCGKNSDCFVKEDTKIALTVNVTTSSPIVRMLPKQPGLGLSLQAGPSVTSV